MTGPLETKAGHYVARSLVGDRPYRAYVPAPLPPAPALDLSPLYGLIDEATQAVARLDGIAHVLPDTDLFLYLYIRKEAVLSSQIEGTQSSLSDLLLFESEEAPSAPLDDVKEVSNYVAALNHGLDLLQGGLPTCSRMIRETHEILLASGRGAEKAPCEFRRTQNWLGGSSPSNATFVPPPPEFVEDLMGDLESFIHEQDVQLPLLVRTALVHVQFETIHPFLDGNGRVGRLLIALMLCEARALSLPLLYLSLYFKTNRSAYYERLMRVRTHGEWLAWLDFFLQGVAETADLAIKAAKEITALFEQDRMSLEGLGRATSSALRVHDYMKRKAILNVPRAQKDLALSAPTIRKSLAHLEKLGIAKEVSGKRRDRVYSYERYLEILIQGTEPLDR